MSKHTKIEKWIRKAFSDAGIVAGYWHRCVSRGQRKACVGAEGKPIKERRKSPERIPCPKCKRPMWVTPIPVSYSTKDLRSTLVTHLSEASKDIDLAARQARHADREVTAKFYRLANVKHLVDGVQVLRFRDGDSAHRLPHNSQENTQKEAKEHKPRMSGGKIT
jgi:integrase